MTETRTTIDEVGELVVTLLATPAHRATACRGWTAHELVAHLAAGAAEEATLIEAHIAGDPPRPTRAHDDRELPFRALPDPDLRDRLLTEAARLDRALEELAAQPARDRVMFTGREMTAADFAMHSRSECALHRWDLVGRDEVGWAMLAQTELTAHALTVLTAMSTLAEAPMHRLAHARVSPEPLRVVIRSEPEPDVVLGVGEGRLTLESRPIDDTTASVELDAAARLLMLWGRRDPSAPIDLHATGAELRVVEALLGWD